MNTQSAVSAYHSPYFAQNQGVTEHPSSANQKEIAGNKDYVHTQQEYYSHEQLVFEYESKDGDTFKLQFEKTEYARIESLMAEASPEVQRSALTDGIREKFLNLQEEILKAFKKAHGEEVSEAEESEKVAQVPDFWNAENTSQRIVDFATSFYSAFEGSGEEFLEMIKGAIEDGFNQARDLMGAMPESVENLTNDTYELTMQKLDEWAEKQGIGVDSIA